jgi:hypothetical protein
MPKQVTKSMCFKLTPEDHSVLEAASNLTGQSMSNLIRMLVRCYLAPQIRAGKVFPGVPLAGPEAAPTLPGMES